MLTGACSSSAVNELLDNTRQALLRGDVRDSMDGLCDTLAGLRAALPHDQWQALGARARAHALHSLLLESPLTRRAYLKPRGYAGDPGLLDLMYGCRERPPDLSAIGQTVYAWELASHACRSVRARRSSFALEIDDMARSQPGAHILAAGCGHLREIELSAAAIESAVTISAFDHDSESLGIVNREYRGFRIRTIRGGTTDLMCGRLPRGKFALVYAADLCAYLNTDLARAVTMAMFRSVAPGGRLLLASFTPDIRDAGYLEMFMDWHVRYRDEHQMRYLAGRIPEEEISGIQQFRDVCSGVTYLRIVRG